MEELKVGQVVDIDGGERGEITGFQDRWIKVLVDADGEITYLPRELLQPVLFNGWKVPA